ncbi:TetR/AcrR family transcriptional regulator, partial [Nocardia sp. NPDC050378]
FPEAGLSEFGQRLRLLVKVVLIQAFGPSDDRHLDAVTDLMVDTGFAAVVRASANDISDRQRRDILEMTAQMMGQWIAGEVTANSDR